MLVKMRLGTFWLTLALVPGISLATPIISGVSSTSGQSTFDGGISSTDLGESATVTGTTPSLGSLAGLNDGAGSPVGTDTSANLNNDCYFDGTAGFGTPNLLVSHPVVVYAFNVGAGGSSTGYNITSVVSTYGWHDHASFSDQDYSIAYSTVANPTVFIPLTSVAFNPFDPSNDSAPAGSQFNSSQVTVTDSSGVLASGVADLQFTFSPYFNVAGLEQAGQVIREIDVNGVATSVPEPAVCGLVLSGLALTLNRRRRVAR